MCLAVLHWVLFNICSSGPSPRTSLEDLDRELFCKDRKKKGPTIDPWGTPQRMRISKSARLRPVLYFQIQMKDFRFSYKFKMACKEDVLRLCPNIKKKWAS